MTNLNLLFFIGEQHMLLKAPERGVTPKHILAGEETSKKTKKGPRMSLCLLMFRHILNHAHKYSCKMISFSLCTLIPPPQMHLCYALIALPSFTVLPFSSIPDKISCQLISKLSETLLFWKDLKTIFLESCD